MQVKKILVFFILLLYCVPQAQGFGHYFILKSRSFFISYDGFIDLSIDFELVGYKEEEFKIMPFFDGGEVRVYDPKSNQWVSGTDLWENMPFLSKDVKLKINTQKDTGNIGFYVLNLTSGEVYETNTVNIWTSYVLRGYLEKLNEHLKMLEYHDESP